MKYYIKYNIKYCFLMKYYIKYYIKYDFLLKNVFKNGKLMFFSYMGAGDDGQS